MSVPPPLLPGAEPLEIEGDRRGALVLHGFTGQPASMRSLATAFGNDGFTVALPCLPGHGTLAEELAATGFSDWVTAADAAYRALTARCDQVVVAALSMGGTLALWIAERHPEVTALVLINPFIAPLLPDQEEALARELAEGREYLLTPHSDVKRPGATGGGYDRMPIRALLSLSAGAAEVAAELHLVRCPILLMTSREDHVVPPASGDTIVDRVHGEVERLFLAESYHVATVDNDASLIEERAVAFARKAVRRT